MPDAAARPAGSIASRLTLCDPDTRIRHHTAADEGFCRALFHEHRAGQFAPLGLSGGLLGAMLDQQYQAQRIAYAQRFPDAEHCIIAHAGADIGQLIVALGKSPDESAALPLGRTLHLVDITIAAVARRCGIGSDVIDSLARAGPALGATRVTLFVLQTNQAAQRLYERLGFVASADGGHVLMVRNLP